MATTPFGAVIPVTGTQITFLGQVTRTGERVITSRQANANNKNNINFGDPVTIVPDSAGGTLRQIADAIANFALLFDPTQHFAGIAVREIKTNLGNYPYTPGPGQTGYYQPGEEAEHLERGSVGVLMPVGTPQANQPVYLRIQVNANVAAGLLGDIEAQADVSATATATVAINSTSIALASVVNPSSSTGIAVGQYITGPGIAAGTYIASGSGTSWVLSQAVTAGIAAGTPVTIAYTVELLPGDVRFRTGIQDGTGTAEITMLRRVAA